MGVVQTVYITFDVDFVDYLNDASVDEFDLTFDNIKALLEKYPMIKTTWFIRIDSQIKKLYGAGDFLFNKHEQKIGWLIDNGHQVGWHHHAYSYERGQWVQNLNEQVILEDLSEFGEMALSKGLNMCRMGWGYHTNSTMHLIDQMGFSLDSSAIPRPNYNWELSVKDWSPTLQEWYHPSVEDYRVQGKVSLSILEVPISTVPLPMSTDTEPNVIRYVNPAYYPAPFASAFDSIKIDKAVMITHPYELSTHSTAHSLLAFSVAAFEENLLYMINQNCLFRTL